jgi:GGDEF domain-containing protein
MKSRQSLIYLIYSIIIVILVLAILVGIPMSTDRQITVHEKIDGFSEGWRLPNGDKVCADDLDIGEFNGRVALEKELSKGITDKDALCFKSENTNIRVFIGGRQVYRFYSKPNLTGMCYGIAYHEVGISKSEAGKTIRLEFEEIYENQKNGRLYDIYLCSASDFLQMVVRNNLLSIIMCILNIFLGITFFIAYVGSSNRSKFPFDILAIGCSAIIMGIWLLIDTNIFQLITGHTYVCRDINKTLPFLIAYPIISFFNSQTEKKRPIYRHLGFATSIVSLFGIIILRYTLRIDMLDSFMKVFIVYVVAGLSLLVIMAVDNALYCTNAGKKNKLGYLYIGGGILIICGILDLIRFFMAGRIKDNHLLFISIGSVIYSTMMLAEFMKWWMEDNAAVERDRFINRALQYALSSNSPDTNIRSILAFLGKELDARRIFVFEDQKNGKYKGTYEWFKEGEKSFSIEIMYLSSEDIIDKIYDEFNKNDHRLIIRDPEVFKDSIPGFYSLIKANKVDNMIIGPLEVGGHLFGVCGVVGAPQKNLEYISEIINLITYFLAQLVLQREEQSRSQSYSYKDALSGCGNYTFFKKYLNNSLDMASPFGCVRCDLARLNEINIEEGYEVGDQIIVDAARMLFEVFGESNVFRVSGTQFIAFGFETEEVFFENDVERLKNMFKEHAIESKVSSVYCLYGTNDINIVLNRLEDLMREKGQENRDEHTDNS